MTDWDGDVYKTVTIGSQTWMAENLRTTKYNDGKPIPNVTNSDSRQSLTTAAYCNSHNTTNADTIATYGRLYNWYTVNTGLLAPRGWHVPTDAEWTTLITYLGGESEAGGKLKEAGITHWFISNIGATNETGFTALPGGYRSDIGKFDIGIYGYWWSASEYETYWVMYYINSWGGNFNYSRKLGCSVRCVRD
jgi:uncharacterized protein (TIGR02145 family)